MYSVLLVVHTMIVLFMIVLILIQRSDQDGMGLSGGGGGNQFLSGRSQANLLTRTTAILATVFIISSLTLAYMGGQMGRESIVDKIAVPAESGAPAMQEAPISAPAPVSPSVPKPE